MEWKINKREIKISRRSVRKTKQSPQMEGTRWQEEENEKVVRDRKGKDKDRREIGPEVANLLSEVYTT